MPLVLAPAAAAGSPARPPGFGAVPPAVAVPGDGLDGPPVPGWFGVVPGGSTDGRLIAPLPAELEPVGRLRSGILLGGMVDEFGGNWMVLGLPASCGTLVLGTFGTLTVGSFGRLGVFTLGSFGRLGLLTV